MRKQESIPVGCLSPTFVVPRGISGPQIYAPPGYHTLRIPYTPGYATSQIPYPLDTLTPPQDTLPPGRGIGPVTSDQEGTWDLWTDWQMPLETLPSRNYCCGQQQESIPVGYVLPACFDHMCFKSHQMSALVGSWSEQVWTGIQWWPPDVTSRGGARAGES